MDRRIFPFREDLAASFLRDRILSLGFSDIRFVEGEEMEICTSCAPLYSDREGDAVSSALLFGERFCVYERDISGRFWGQSLTDHYVGYISPECLSPLGMRATHFIRVCGSFIYAQADIKSPVMCRLSFASRISVREFKEDFAILNGGGYVYGPHVLSFESRPSLDHISFGLQFLHVPYLWGGRTNLGIDCSALVQLCLFLCGYSAPRDSDLQEQWDGFVAVRDKDLCRGDFVFWPGHVGMMVDEEILLHANAHHMFVAQEPLSDTMKRIGAPSSFCRLK